ncbi:MAG TPA: cupin domain-containing protein [Gemmatimonadaceae bacterium]
MKTVRTIPLAALIGGSVFALHVPAPQQSGIKRTDLQRHDLSAAGREVIQTRVELAPGTSFGKHWHPGEEIIYMIEGSLQYQIDDEPPVTLKAGDVLFVPARTIHAARNVGDVPGAELATYVVEKGKPLLVMVK